MPQMSPLGWMWLVIFISLGYMMFLSMFYSIFLNFLGFSLYSMKLSSMSWLW